MRERKIREQGICPACSGTGKVPIEESEKQYWNQGKTHKSCKNCGGQTMEGYASGKVNLRDDGTPCLHEVRETKLGNCYYGYTCIHCGYSYNIDSGD